VNISVKPKGSITQFVCLLCRNERANGYYRVSAYFFAMVFCDLIPKRIAPVTLFTACVYFLTGQSYSVILHHKELHAGLTAN